MPALLFASVAAILFAGSLGFFLYSYFVTFGISAASGSILRPAALNLALFSLFALHHSLFARTGAKRFVAAYVPPRLERALYTFISSASFMVVCRAWQPVPGVLYDMGSAWQLVGYGFIVAGAIVVLAGARALDFLELAGIRQVLGPGRSGRVVRPLATRGVYGLVRHPLYFGWVLIVFGVPHMTATRFTFAIVSTLYLAVAIPLEERGLAETFGLEYASYRKMVRWRMLPGVF